MNQDVKPKWLAALRSDEYEQGQEYLRTAGDRYCCLGVLCDLAVKEGVIPEPTLTPYETYAYEWETNASGLGPAVQKWAGLEGNGALGNLPEPVDGYAALAFLNDNGKTFREIADIIEKEL